LEQIERQEKQGQHFLLYNHSSRFKLSIIDQYKIVLINIVLEKEIESQEHPDRWKDYREYQAHTESYYRICLVVSMIKWVIVNEGHRVFFFRLCLFVGHIHEKLEEMMENVKHDHTIRNKSPLYS
jgi:hypothetical protein